ncbi:MAG: tetraacyldisaccharide 4'-kinase, partial [Candidatus Krumholzibacteria bacterium]|nr:tetraacyldisaccharide 4'-kinase [Candidatus Krumholzibacteria bacterium]
MPRSPQAEPTYTVFYPLRRRERTAAVLRRLPLSLLTPPAAFLYKIVSERLRRTRLRARGRSWGGVTVVSIGNLEIGGNGKTPFAIHLVGELAERGFRPVYVSRGFKSEAEKMGLVTLRVPNGVNLE